MLVTPTTRLIIRSFEDKDAAPLFADNSDEPDPNTWGGISICYMRGRALQRSADLI